jgi:hypothetical protein
MKGIWEIIVKREMLELIEKGSQPQEQSLRKGPKPAREVIAELMARKEEFHTGWVFPKSLGGASVNSRERK